MNIFQSLKYILFVIYSSQHIRGSAMINENELTSSSLSEQPSDEPNKKLDSTRTVSTLLNNFISERNS